MSNQEYRKEPKDPPSREARLAAARLRIEAYRAKGNSAEEAVSKYMDAHYVLQGGKEIDSQIEGMLLVIEEGKIYRRQALAFEQQMKEWLAGDREDEPYEPKKPHISGATMVSASRQLETLRERRVRVYEDAEIRLANSLDNIDEKKKQKAAQAAELGQSPPAELPPTQPPTDKEAAPVKGDNRAATAAA